MTDFLSMTVQQVEGLPETKVQEVLEAWVKAKKAELPQALAQSTSKAHVKLAKKALYRLQSSGVEVVTEAPKGSAPIIDLTPKNDFPAVLSMQLGTGERAFLFAVPIRGGGGLEVFQGIVSDEFGLAQFGSERANRALYRKRMEQLKTELTTRAMLVPMERLKLELGRAITLNERTKTPYGGEIEQALNSIGVSKQDPDFPIPSMEPGDSENREGGAALHAFPEVEQWLPSEKDLITLSARVEAIRNGPLPLSDEQKEEKVKKLAHELAVEVFTPELRMLYARRLWYSAEVIEFQKRDADAALTRSEARRLAHETTASRFLEQLFVKALPAKK